MSKKFSITLSDGIYADLARLAKRDGAQPASKAAFYVESAIVAARERGDLDALPQDGNELLKGAIAYINALAQGGSIGMLDLQKLADELKVPSDRLAKILKQAKGEITNGNHH